MTLDSTAKGQDPVSDASSHAKLTASFKLLMRHSAAQGALDFCMSLLDGEVQEKSVAQFLSGMDEAERQYWISSIYTSLMQPKRRKRLAAFFTPPYLVDHVLDSLERRGVDFTKAKVVDPACGGGAFLAPLARRISRATGLTGNALLKKLKRLMQGYEIEPNLARLSAAMVAQACGCSPADGPAAPINTANSLKLGTATWPRFDVVVANPPYGRVFRPSKTIKERWSNYLTSNYVNTYAIFTALCLEMVRPGGFVALVIPTSFIGGEYYRAFRAQVLQFANVVSIDLIDERDTVFVDVVQDTCVLLLKRRARVEEAPMPVSCALATMGAKARVVGQVRVPISGDAPWLLPSQEAIFDNSEVFASRLVDYGYRARTGNIVWNRSRHLLAREGNVGGVLPLLWASDVQAGRRIDEVYLLSESAAGVRSRYVKMDVASRSTLKGPTILLQRTTNKNQDRRIIASIVDETVVARWGAYISENHTIVIEPIVGCRQAISLEEMCSLLNSRYFDDRFRRVSGTVSVGTRLIETVPLPKPADLEQALAEQGDMERALSDLLKARGI